MAIENPDRPYEAQEPKQLRTNLPLPLHEALEAEYVAVVGKLELPDGYAELKRVANPNVFLKGPPTDQEYAEGVRCLLAAGVAAAGFHALLALPHGDLGGDSRRRAVVVAYGLALAVGLAAWAGPGELSGWARLGLWALALAAGFPASHRRYLETGGTERQRLQWLGCGVVRRCERRKSEDGAQNHPGTTAGRAHRVASLRPPHRVSRLRARQGRRHRCRWPSHRTPA